jgi:S-adenosylmethionine decarboxylase
MSMGKVSVSHKKTSNFGMHLMLDAYGANAGPLNDMRTVFRFLDELPSLIGMHKLAAPFVVDAKETQTGKDPGGVTGFVLIAESHISIHTFPKRGFFTLDLYSCNNFDDQVETILEYIHTVFGFTKKELRIVKRGLKYPKENINEKES